jgi:hypothetical protein
MKVLNLSDDEFSTLELDLCNKHGVPVDDDRIEIELKDIQGRFCVGCPSANESDYEFPDWHNHCRLFWAYLYTDDFFDTDFVPLICKVISSQPRSWFAQFECYSPSLESSELPTGAIGDFLVFEDTVAFCEDEAWQLFRPRLGF